MLLLGVGVGALLGTSVLTTRMVIRGRQATRGAQAASARFEELRAQAARPPAYCAALAGGADSAADGTVRRWWIRPFDGQVEATVAVVNPVAGGWATDSFSTVLPCP